MSRPRMSRPRMSRPLLIAASLAALVPALATTPATAQITRIKAPDPKAIILAGARIAPGSELYYLSGQLASPLDPTKPPSASPDDYGDTKTQTISTLTKIKAQLEASGYKMSDVFKLTLFVAADPKTGKMDFAGANAGFREFFGTAENPETVARSTFQVAALAAPQFLIEIEAIAAKAPAKPAKKKK